MNPWCQTSTYHNPIDIDIVCSLPPSLQHITDTYIDTLLRTVELLCLSFDNLLLHWIWLWKGRLCTLVQHSCVFINRQECCFRSWRLLIVSHWSLSLSLVSAVSTRLLKLLLLVQLTQWLIVTQWIVVTSILGVKYLLPNIVWLYII